MFKLLGTGLLAGLFSSTMIAAEEKPADTRIFELRTYHAEPGKLDKLLTRFRDHTTKLFVKHGMTNIGYWVPVENTGNTLVYLLAYPDRDARDSSWKAFINDPEWLAAAKASEVDGKLVGKIDQLFLTPTAFSPGFGTPTDNAPRLFEMRTYTTPAGRLPALHKRFADHTIQLFKKHGMTNLGYFQPAPGQPETNDTLLYFLAHKDAAAAAQSWQDFRGDPDWDAIRKASEAAAGGSLTMPDGVKSLFLTSTDFSPIR